MMFANPWALFGLLLAVPIVWLYRCAAPLPETTVAAGALWQEVLAEQRVRSWWLPRRHLASLAAQLSILALVVLAWAGPRLSPPRTTILILDASARMNAADVPPSRLEAARQHARRLIDSLPATDRLGILAAGTPLRVVCAPTGDRRQLHEALESVADGAGRAQVPEAVRVARSMFGDRPGNIVVLTDAGFAEASDLAQAGDVDLYTVGGQAANVAVRRVAARRDPGRLERTQVLVELASHPAVAPGEIPLDLQLDGVVLKQGPVQRSEGPRRTKIYQWASPEPGILTILAESDDVLPGDNRGSTAIPPASIHRLLLVSEISPHLEAALQASPAVRTERLDELPAAPVSGAILVLQGEVPPRLPEGPLLVIGPRNASDLWDVDGVVQHATVAQQDLQSSILAGLDLDGIVFADVGRLRVRTIDPNRVHVVAAAEDREPLLLALDRPGGRVVVIAGNPDRSELLHQAEFSTLLTQSLRWLVGQPDQDKPEQRGEAAVAFPADDSDLRVPQDVGTPADRWQWETPRPAPWMLFGTLALAMLVSEWCLYQRRWIS